MSKKLFLLPLAATPISLPAHHSVAEYDRSALVEVEGTLTEIRWRNPHMQLSVQAEGPNRVAPSWELEAAAPYVLERARPAQAMMSCGSRVRSVIRWHVAEQARGS